MKSGSDITIGDFWGIQHVFPNFDDDKGVSAVMVNTPRGAVFYDGLQADSIETTYADIRTRNTSVEKSVPVPKGRNIFIRSMDSAPMVKTTASLTKPSVAEYVKHFLKRVFTWLKVFPIIGRICKK
jgi:hypothetical protein